MRNMEGIVGEELSILKSDCAGLMVGDKGKLSRNSISKIWYMREWGCAKQKVCWWLALRSHVEWVERLTLISEAATDYEWNNRKVGMTEG